MSTKIKLNDAGPPQGVQAPSGGSDPREAGKRGGIKLLMIDNYDSFTFNIVQYFGELGAEVTVVRNDEITVDEIQRSVDAGEVDRLVISPGPCSPA
ncbi:MAG: hypothetical protein WEK74_16315, partial [Hydrogenophaga sp.]